MIPHKMTISEAKKIDLLEYLAAWDGNQKKYLLFFLFTSNLPDPM